MKRIFVCSPFGGNKKNRSMAKKYCKYASDLGYAPFAPHVFYTSFLDESTDRQRGLASGMSWLEVADELWVFGYNITAGMEQEIIFAAQHGIKTVRVKDSEVTKIQESEE